MTASGGEDFFPAGTEMAPFEADCRGPALFLFARTPFRRAYADMLIEKPE